MFQCVKMSVNIRPVLRSTKLHRLSWHCNTTTAPLWIQTNSQRQISQSILSLDISEPTTHRAICFLWPLQTSRPHIQICKTVRTQPVSLLLFRTKKKKKDPWSWLAKLSEHSLRQHHNNIQKNKFPNLAPRLRWLSGTNLTFKESAYN